MKHDKIFYYGYIKNVWSKDFKKVVNDLTKINDLIFLIQETDRILFKIPEKKLQKVFPPLLNSVRSGAWHDMVSNEEIIVIFNRTDIRRMPLSISPKDGTWQKMKEQEPSVRKYATLKDMIHNSIYSSFLS